MYYFVEYLRGKAALRIAFILLGILFLTAVVVRVAIHGPTVLQWSSQLQQEPGAHVTRTTLPDGSVRVVVDNPSERTHAVIIQGSGNVRIDVTEPANRSTHHDIMSVGTLRIHKTIHLGIAHTTVDYRGGIVFDIGLLFAASLPMGLIVATMLAGPLSKENDGHLELAWTKPVSRERYALASIVVDAVTILISQLCATIVAVLGMLLFSVPKFTVTSWLAPELLIAIFGALAWYALLTAASASVKRGPGIVIGLGWLAAVIIPSLSAGLADSAQYSSVAKAFYLLFHSLAYIDPLSYLTIRVLGHGADVLSAVGTSIMTSVFVLIGLTICYIALSVLQWRRVEA